MKELKKATGNRYGVDKNNNLYMKEYTTKAPSSKISLGLSNKIDEAIKGTSNLPFFFVKNDNGTLFDSYLTANFDVGDFKRVENRAVFAGLISHVFEERLVSPGYDNPANRTLPNMAGVAPGTDNFTIAHNAALLTESKIVSNMLTIPNVTRTNSFTPIYGTRNLNVSFEYGATRFGIIYNSDSGELLSNLK